MSLEGLFRDVKQTCDRRIQRIHLELHSCLPIVGVAGIVVNYVLTRDLSDFDHTDTGGNDMLDDHLIPFLLRGSFRHTSDVYEFRWSFEKSQLGYWPINIIQSFWSPIVPIATVSFKWPERGDMEFTLVATYKTQTWSIGPTVITLRSGLSTDSYSYMLK